MQNDFIDCRKGCGACCIHISISSALPNHPNGKKAGERCKNLSNENACLIWDRPDFPDICKRFRAVKWVCGDNADEATINIINLEKLTGV